MTCDISIQIREITDIVPTALKALMMAFSQMFSKFFETLDGHKPLVKLYMFMLVLITLNHFKGLLTKINEASPPCCFEYEFFSICC